MNIFINFIQSVMEILIKNGIVVTQNRNREIIQGDVLIEENFITSVGKEIKEKPEIVIDAKNKIIIPGLINTHTHVGMGLFRGFVEDVSLDMFLDKTFTLDSKRTDDDIYFSSFLSMIEMLRTGTTSFFDLYYSEDIIAKAAIDTGIRAFLSWVTLDKEYTTQKGDPLKNAENFISQFIKMERIHPSVGFQGVYVCSDETFLKGFELAKKYGTFMHMHLSETRKEVYEHVKKKNQRPVEYLYNLGILNDKLLAAHTVWLTQREIKMLAEKNVNVSHNPVSNMKLGTGGAAPVPEMVGYGVNVTLGTDSVVSNNNLDLFNVMKVTGLMHKNEKWDASVLPAQEIFDMATINGAKAVGMKNFLGSIEEGKLADIVVIDPFPNGLPLRKENIIPNIVYSIEGFNVNDVIVDGRIVMRNREFTDPLREIVEKNREKLYSGF